jgi:hypothetical protein
MVIDMNTPECDRMLAVKEKSQLIGEFLDWLGSQGLTICRLRDVTCDGEEIDPQQYLPNRESIEQLLARFFSIDLVKVEAERRKILEDLRSKK